MEPEEAEEELRARWDQGGNYVIRVIRTWMRDVTQAIDLDDYAAYDEPDADES